MRDVKKTIRVGDAVMVSYPRSDVTNNPARRLEGQEFIVKSKRCIDSRGGDRIVYELYGAVSAMGKPYSFLTDELTRV